MDEAEVAGEAVAPAVDEGKPPERPVSLREFARSLKGTPDEVWTRLLFRRHGTIAATPTEWRERIAVAGRLPAH